jgi:hypothetical protein
MKFPAITRYIAAIGQHGEMNRKWPEDQAMGAFRNEKGTAQGPFDLSLDKAADI